MATVHKADATVCRTGDMSIVTMPMEAKSEKTPMIGTDCELRGTDFQTCDLLSRTREL
jgi:hypothetical protein